MNDILDVKELAKYLHCSVSTVRKLVRENGIPYFRIASRIFFNKNRIDGWIECQETNTTGGDTYGSN